MEALSRTPPFNTPFWTLLCNTLFTPCTVSFDVLCRSGVIVYQNMVPLNRSINRYPMFWRVTLFPTTRTRGYIYKRVHLHISISLYHLTSLGTSTPSPLDRARDAAERLHVMQCITCTSSMSMLKQYLYASLRQEM